VSTEDPSVEYGLGATEALPEEDIHRFLSTLSEEEHRRVDLSEPGVIVINTSDGRLIDKLPRTAYIEAQIDGEIGRVDTLEYVLQLLSRP